MSEVQFSVEALIQLNSLSHLRDLSYRCFADKCDREFNTKRNLVDHCRGHHQVRRPHPCNFPGCGKSFLRPAHLLIHSRIHTGEKPFECEFDGCGKRWNQKSALKQHMRSHTGEKPFVCTFKGCHKKFSTSSSCKRHVRTHHRTLNENECVDDSKTSECDSYSPVYSPQSSSSDGDVDEEVARAMNHRHDKYCSFQLFTFNDDQDTKMAVDFLLN